MISTDKFDTPEAAARALDQKVMEQHLDPDLLNFPEESSVGHLCCESCHRLAANPHQIVIACTKFCFSPSGRAHRVLERRQWCMCLPIAGHIHMREGDSISPVTGCKLLSCNAGVRCQLLAATQEAEEECPCGETLSLLLLHCAGIVLIGFLFISSHKGFPVFIAHLHRSV